MSSITENTKGVIADGMSTMDNLSTKSADTTNITKNVTSNIRNLEESLSSIEGFVEMINDIAEETTASVSTVNDSLKNQMTMIDHLHSSTVELEDRAKELSDAVNAFKI